MYGLPTSAVLALAIAVVGSVATAGDDLSEQAARQRLTEAGLINDGFVWLLPEEERLVRQLERVDRLGREVRSAEKRVEAMVAQNETHRREIQQSELLLAQVQSAADDARRTTEQREIFKRQADSLRNRLGQLRQLYLPPEKFAGHHQVRHEVIGLINARNELGLLTTQIPATHLDMQDKYLQLSKQPAVVAALSALGQQHQLGSQRKYERMVGRLGPFRQLAHANVVPLYISDGRTRVSIVVNDSAVATVTWEADGELSLLPESLLVRAGVTVSADAPSREVSYRGRTVRGRVVTVPYLRLGNRVASEVAVLALPPEFEDVGAVLQTGAISNFRSQPNPAAVRLDFPQ